MLSIYSLRLRTTFNAIFILFYILYYLYQIIILLIFMSIYFVLVTILVKSLYDRYESTIPTYWDFMFCLHMERVKY